MGTSKLLLDDLDRKDCPRLQDVATWAIGRLIRANPMSLAEERSIIMTKLMANVNHDLPQLSATILWVCVDDRANLPNDGQMIGDQYTQWPLND
jgi:hypothetical protein